MSVTIRSTNPKITDDNVAKLEKYMEENAALPEVSASDNGSTLQVANGAWSVGDKIPDAVTANPTGEITNDLSGIQIGDTKYKIGLVSSDTLADGTDKATYIRNDWSKFVSKSGNVKNIILTMQMKEVSAATGSFEIFKLPAGYEPSRAMSLTVVSNTNKAFTISISTTGEITLDNPPATNIDIIGISLTYI